MSSEAKDKEVSCFWNIDLEKLAQVSLLTN